MKVKTIGESENTILTQGVDFTISDKTVTFTTAPTGLFMIYRETTTSRLVEWADASVLTASDMTLQEVQLLHLTEETGDKVQDNGMAIDETDASWDARYARIKNLLDPKEDGDAVTLRYMNDNANAWQRKVVTEGDTQVKRVTAEGDKQVSRVTDTGDSYISTMDDKLAESNQHTVDAAASASKAKASETAAKASETKAKTSEDNAKVSETKAKTSETNAKTSETNAKASETKAKASENAAAASASNAKTSETNAKASETAAADSKTRSWSWAENTSSPSNNADTQSPTGKQQSSRSWALYSRDKALEAKEVAQGIGNPVKSVTENNGKVTVTQADGTTSQFNAGLNILARNKAYAVGDIAYSPNLPSYMYLECVTAGTTSAKEPDFSKVTTGGVRVTDGTAVWRPRDKRTKHCTGEIFPWVYGTPPESERALLCDGSQVPEAYYELLQLMGGQKTLPDLTGRFLQGSETAGNVVKAGMPNITGSLPFFTYLNPGETINNGALSGTYINASNPITGESTLLTFYNSRLDFNASKSNSIYGNANTVQPPAYTVKYYICGA